MPEGAELDYVGLMRAQRARAVILIGSRSDDAAATEALRAEIAAFTAAGGRAACVGQDLLGVDTVLPENRLGAQALAKALAVQGHRSFAVLAGPRGLLTARDRLDGFRDGLAAWSVVLEPSGRALPVQPRWRLRGHERYSRGRAAVAGLRVRRYRRHGRWRPGQAAGGRPPCPRREAVAGFDDISTLRDVYPPLTTVRLPLKRMGEIAAGLVLGDPAASPARVLPVPGKVPSCGKARSRNRHADRICSEPPVPSRHLLRASPPVR